MRTTRPLVVPAFWHAHATHPDPHMALALAAAQIDAQSGAERSRATLGWIYFSDRYAPHAEGLLDELRQRWPAVAWVGTVGVAICASGVEYSDEPALALMLAALPPDSFMLYNGAHGLPSGLSDRPVHAALVHADGQVPELGELIHELAGRTASGYLFGGLSASAAQHYMTRAYQLAPAALVSAVGFLPEDQRTLVLDRQRDVVSAVTRFLQRAYPDRVQPHNQAAIAMMVFGMINWTFTWLRPGGPMSYAAFADEVVAMLEGGLTGPVPVSTPGG